MLRDLHIEKLALIDDLWLDFGPGLTVLTGETGAGKTVLLSAMELIMGGRGDSGQIAAGAQKAKVEASIDLQQSLNFSELTISRTMTSAGRTRVLLNGDLSSVSALQKTVGPLIDLHGQHDHQALLSASQHMKYLDRWAAVDVGPLLDEYLSCRNSWKSADKELKNIQELIELSIDQREAAKLALADIDAINPLAGEDDQLRESLPVLQNCEEIARLCTQATDALCGEGAALERLYDLDSLLEQLSVYDKNSQDLRQQAVQTRSLLEGIADAVAEFEAGISHEPRAIEDAYLRLSELEALSKRYGPTLDAVLRRRDEFEGLVDVADNSEQKLFEARDAEIEAKNKLIDAAKALSIARHKAAKDFVSQLSAAATDLELGKVRFDIDFSTLDFHNWTDRGSEGMQILYAPAPAVPARPLSKIASGGEISRVMLALKSVLGDADNTKILVFDEVDAGIGGATGMAVGAKLKKLSKSHQVIVVTHLAQVAAFADAHFLVSKIEDSTTEAVKTQVESLDEGERVHEIARMLSGSVSTTAIKHAKELFDSASESSN